MVLFNIVKWIIVKSKIIQKTSQSKLIFLIQIFQIHSATLKEENEQTEKENNNEVEPETSAKENSDNLPVLEPGDQLLIRSANPQIDPSKRESALDTPEVQRRNVLDKITDRGKNIISILYPPYEEERNEQKFDDSERKKAEKYALSTDQILLTDALGIKPVEVNSRHVSQPTPLAQVVEGRVITEETKEELEHKEGNSKLWIGKDYTNFIVKDFNNLDLPFVGESVLLQRFGLNREISK